MGSSCYVAPSTRPLRPTASALVTPRDIAAPRSAPPSSNAPTPSPKSGSHPSLGHRLSRRFFAFALAVLCLGLSRSSFGIDATVPADLQAELLSKLAPYDRNFAGRAGSQAKVLL